MNNSPIGVFDSGMGGLSVWRELRKTLPAESIVYYGDGAHCPYGEKPAAEVATYIDCAVRELLAAGAKLIVLACNTATMIAVKRLRATYPVPFVGMEPAIKPAAATTPSCLIISQYLHAACLFPQSSQRILNRSIGQIALKINKKTIFPISLFDRPALYLTHIKIIVNKVRQNPVKGTALM